MVRKHSNLRFLVNITADTAQFGEKVPDKVHARYVLEVLFTMNDQLKAGGWDQPPLLGFLYQRSRKAIPGGEAAYMQMHPVPIFEGLCHRYDRPHQAIRHVAEAARKSAEFLGGTPGDLIGVVCVTEAWGVFSEDDNPLPPEEVEAVARRRELHLHPDRKEMRSIIAVDEYHTVYSVMQIRDGERSFIVSQPDDVGRRLGGDVPLSLRYLAEVVTGQDPPDWATYFARDEERLRERDADRRADDDHGDDPDARQDGVA